ncbi:heme NO-binding domain-containing protein [Mycobacterium sp. M26]|uniref:heme NO-binding domain-containing protein n=1 Tax=Mycobacterium sp. M26 TaxID=1762962 RepID=UPI00073E25F2|nr:heme NO-binding domain-containing protein [Mycobacterium sp. M26]
MKGAFFNLLEEVVVANYGDQTWDELLDAAGLDGVYTSLGSYDDDDMTRLVSAAGAALTLPDDEVLRWFGRQAIPHMVKRWPDYFTAHEQTVPFLRSLNDVIHPEVRKLYAGAYCPHFDFTSPANGSLLIGYRSPRRLCGLAHGFILGAADHYGESLTVQHVECMHDGSTRCLVEVAAA